MTSLVLEGGTLRGIFTAGVLDGFLEKGIEFPYIVGVSAGISNAASYVSKQFRRNIDIIDNYRLDKRYIGAGNFLKCKSLFGLDFVYDQIPNKLIPFDYDAFRRYDGKFLVGIFNAESGRTEFVDGIKDNERWEYLRATCSIPGYFPAARINGNYYYDGGLVSPISIEKAINDGFEKHIIILTQPKGYVKKLGKSNIVMSKLIRGRFPKMETVLLSRHTLYNKQVKLCEQLEKDGKAIIIRPEHKLENLEKNISVLDKTWQEGFDTAISMADKINAFMMSE